ncbi:hypothetical protein SUDANB96_06757 (plasmid) [Streptomyces sp. enrichment culture]
MRGAPPLRQGITSRAAWPPARPRHRRRRTVPGRSARHAWWAAGAAATHGSGAEPGRGPIRATVRRSTSRPPADIEPTTPHAGPPRPPRGPGAGHTTGATDRRTAGVTESTAAADTGDHRIRRGCRHSGTAAEPPAVAGPAEITDPPPRLPAWRGPPHPPRARYRGVTASTAAADTGIAASGAAAGPAGIAAEPPAAAGIGGTADPPPAAAGPAGPPRLPAPQGPSAPSRSPAPSRTVRTTAAGGAAPRSPVGR